MPFRKCIWREQICPGALSTPSKHLLGVRHGPLILLDLMGPSCGRHGYKFVLAKVLWGSLGEGVGRRPGPRHVWDCSAGRLGWQGENLRCV